MRTCERAAFSYPLRLNYSFASTADGTATQITTSDQRDLERESRPDANGRVAHTRQPGARHRHVAFDASFNILRPLGSQTTRATVRRTSAEGCYSRTLTAQAQKLVSVSDGAAAKSSG